MRRQTLVLAILLAAVGCQQTQPTRPSTARPDGAREPEVSPEIKKAFPDYRPKTTPDTVWDYRPGFVLKLKDLPPAELAALPDLLKALDDAKAAAAKTPGKWTQGRVYLGADPKQYEPSDAELRAAEIGDRVKHVVDAGPPQKLKKALQDAGITATEVTYRRFNYRHVDVMGSGRFTYASDPIATTVPLAAK